MKSCCKVVEKMLKSCQKVVKKLTSHDMTSHNITLHDLTSHHMREGHNSGQNLYLLKENMSQVTECTCFYLNRESFI